MEILSHNSRIKDDKVIQNQNEDIIKENNIHQKEEISNNTNKAIDSVITSEERLQFIGTRFFRSAVDSSAAPCTKSYKEALVLYVATRSTIAS